MLLPSEATALQVVGYHYRAPVRSIARFRTGLHNWVYDVLTEAGQALVVRIASSPNRPYLAGAVYWHGQLSALDIPLPTMLHAVVDHDPPYLILERLPGTDLADEYAALSPAQRSAIAARIAALQGRVAQLPLAAGFGYAFRYADALLPRWEDVLEAAYSRACDWLAGGPFAGSRWPRRVVQALQRHAGHFPDVRPRAFLHDTTTKNVLVSGGRVTGIVDVDTMAFGDPLWTVALTRMSLLARGQPTDYIDAWLGSMPHAADARRLDLYTALHGLTLLGEIGRPFNRGPSAPDPEYAARLDAVLGTLVG